MGRPYELHGLSAGRHPLYETWKSMRGRCYRKSAKAFQFYGGRGIRVCDRWRLFSNFLADMGDRPEGTSLDRIDVNGHYEPSNCRWATPAVQHSNTRTNTFYSLNGERFTRSEWERRLGLSTGALWHRIKNGWPLERALTTPNLNKARKHMSEAEERTYSEAA